MARFDSGREGLVGATRVRTLLVAALAVMLLMPVAAGAVDALEADDDIPGVALPASGYNGYVSFDGTDPDEDGYDVFAVSLASGQKIDIQLSWSPGKSLLVAMFPPGTASVRDAAADWKIDANTGSGAFSYTALAAGTHYLVVRAWDPRIGYSLSYTLGSSDTIAPTVTFDPAATYVGSAAIPLSATDNVGVTQLHYMFSTDGVTFGETQHVAGSSTTINVSTVGQHWVRVFAHDQANNYSAPITRAFTVVAAPVAIPKLTLLSKPNAPTTMYKGKAKTISGYLKPRHTAGTYPVRIYKYRYVSGKWRSYGYVKAKASNYSTYTKYTKAFSLPYAGKWRLRAVAPADSLHATTYSTYDYVTVK